MNSTSMVLRFSDVRRIKAAMICGGAMKPEPGIAVVGSGYWGRNLVRNFHALGALRAVCDPNAEALASVTCQYPGVNTLASFEKVLLDPSVHGVAIATPASLHGSMARDALAAGKDVFVEKPLAATLEQGEQLVRLAARRKRILMVGHLLWYHPAILKLEELVRAGELGRLQYLYSQRLNLGRFRREENILWSFAPHDVSVILGLTREMPESVHAEGGNYLHNRIADVTVTWMSFPSGVSAHVFVSWLHPYKEQRLVVIGDRKMAVFNDLETKDKLVLYPHRVDWRDNFPVPNRGEAEPVAVEMFEPLLAECRHFLECVKERCQPRTDGLEGVKVLTVLQKCQEALESDRHRRPKESSSHAEENGAVFIHPTATVDEDASIGNGTKVWHYSHIMSGARIGNGCVLGQNVFVGRNVLIGNSVKIQNNVSVYEGVTIEDQVFCGPSVVFTNVANPRAAIERKSEFLPTRVRQGATLGANATILCGHTIGSYAFVGAGTVVTADVPDYALVVGVPGRIQGWVCQCGTRLNFFPARISGEEQASCERCGIQYAKKESQVEVLFMDGPSR